MSKTALCNLFEIMRWVTVIIGLQLSYYFDSTQTAQIHILAPWLVIPMAGLTGLESIFLADAARQQSGYAASPYQRQSGLNNVALAITAILVFVFGWGEAAELTVVTVLLIFLFLSGCNHAWSAWKENNRTIKNFLRPVMSLILILSCLPILLRFSS